MHACGYPGAWACACAYVHVKCKGFPLQAWSGSWGSRRFRLLDLLGIRHYECGKVVTLTHRPPLPPGVSWYSFLEAESTPGHMVPSVASEKIPTDTTGDRSRDPPTSSAVLYPLRHTTLYSVSDNALCLTTRHSVVRQCSACHNPSQCFRH
jgi:hypothetical protein